MNFFERPPSKQWAVLKYRGKQFADVWFKPEGEPFALTFRIPQEIFQTPGIVQLLTMENLLKAVAIATEEVENWRMGDVSNTEFNHILPGPEPGLTHLILHVNMKPPRQDVTSDQASVSEADFAKWHDLQTRWKGIVNLEASIDSLRQSVESARIELDNLGKKPLAPEERIHALSSDVSQLNKAKSRVHHGLPRARDFVQRSTWAMVTPERKALGEFFDERNQSVVPIDQLDYLSHQLDNLLKDRQVLSAQGVTVSQECKNIASEIRTALSTLQNNAAARARQKKSGTRGKGK